MRHWRLFFLSAALLTLPVFWPCPHAMAQTAEVEPLSASQPCDEIGRPGRPTLVRRVSPDAQTTGTVDQKTVEGKCSSLEDRSDRQLVSLRFVGLNTLRESDVMSSFREEGVVLRRDRMPDAETADKAAAVLKRLLSTKGYVYADVSAITDERFHSVTFQVTEGERLPLADIHFEDTKVFSADELKATTRGCLSKLEKSEDGYDQELLEYCQRNAENFIRNRGYLQAKIGKPKIDTIGNRIVANFKVEEGSLYRLGNITIEGADVLSAVEIRAMLPLGQGEVVDVGSISKWLFEDLRKSYADRGFIEFTAEPVPDFRKTNDVEGVVDFKVIIEEGDRFTLRSIELEGAPLTTAELLNQSPLQPGSIYNASAFAAFVNQLNQTGLFEPIDKDQDSAFRVNNEERVVSIHIKLRRRSQP